MIIKEYSTLEEMLNSLPLLNQVYPSLTEQEYIFELKQMIPNNYKQVVIEDNSGNCIGISGYWIGYKLWCGKYLELDNVAVAEEYRSKGIGQMIVDYLRQKGENEKCTMLALDSYTTNFDAHKFFYKNDFQPRGFHFINVLDEKKVR